MSFVLHVFPESGLASSLITTVWIGVFVVCFFNLKFGWNLSGLIVPGYLVPLLIIKPWSSVAIIIEAVFTYFLIWFFSEFASKSGFWSNLFGRDRFFAILLFAVIARMLFDCLIFPELSIFMNNYFNVAFVYKGGLYSIGLVIVALAANQFWNPGFKRGFPQLMVNLFIAYLIIQFILIRYTNFRMSEVAYLYEDIATSIAASPKAYIILIVTAYFASRMNLLYGWEFGGIVLPALLALQWYYPWKILSSIVEAGIIYGLAVLILKTPLFRNITIEGARKILLFFNIAFFYKMLVGFTLPLIFPSVVILDVYGLGYMLTSLIAIKMFDKKIGLKMTRNALQTSLIAVIVATLIGFGLLYIPIPGQQEAGGNMIAIEKHGPSTKYVKATISDALLSEQVRLYGTLDSSRLPDSADLVAFEDAIKAIRYYVPNRSAISLRYASSQLNKIGYNLEIIEDKYVLLYENNWRNSRGIYVISLEKNNNMLVKLPLSRQGPAIIEASFLILKNNKYAALAIAGGKSVLNTQLKQYLNNKKIFYEAFCRVFNKKATLQIFEKDNFITEQFDEDEQKNISGKNFLVWDPKLKLKNNETFISIREKLIEFQELTVKPSFVRKNDYSVSLVLSDKEIVDIIAASGLYDMKYKVNLEKNELIKNKSGSDNIIRSTVKAIGNIFASNKKNEEVKKNIPLTNEQANFLDIHVLTPIIQTSVNSKKLSDKPDNVKLQMINFAANILGCKASLTKIGNTDNAYITLSNFEKNQKIFLGGTYFFALNNFNPYIIEVINPSNKQNWTLSLYMSVYLKARALFIAGTIEAEHNFVFYDDSIPVKSLFNLTNQVMMREADIPPVDDSKDTKDKADYRDCFIQIRLFPDVTNKKLPSSDSSKSIFLSTYDGKYDETLFDDPEKKVYDFLKKCGFTVNIVKGQAETAGLEAYHSNQTKYMPQTNNTDFMLIWVKPDFKISKTVLSDLLSEKKSAGTNKQKTKQSTNSKVVITNKNKQISNNIKPKTSK